MKNLFVFMLCATCFIQPVQAAGYILKQGKGYGICEALKTRLDKLGDLKKPMHCNRWLADDIPGLKEPEWQDLDIEAHWDLLIKLAKDNTNLTETAFNHYLARLKKGAAAGNVKLQVLRVNLVTVYEKPGEEKIETIARIWEQDNCDGRESANTSINFVTEDLQEIDVATEKRVYWFSNGDLSIYNNRHYAVKWNDSDFLISSDFGSGFVPFCTIAFDWKAYSKTLPKQ